MVGGTIKEDGKNDTPETLGAPSTGITSATNCIPETATPGPVFIKTGIPRAWLEVTRSTTPPLIVTSRCQAKAAVAVESERMGLLGGAGDGLVLDSHSPASFLTRNTS